MKTTIVRLSVLALAFTGFAASSVVSHARKSAPVVTPVVVATIYSAPLCAPHDPSRCGMD